MRYIYGILTVAALVCVGGAAQVLASSCVPTTLSSGLQNLAGHHVSRAPLSSAAIKASMSNTMTFRSLPEIEQKSRLKVFELRDRFLLQVQRGPSSHAAITGSAKLEYFRAVKGLADATRVTGESAASVGDLVSSQALTREALSYFEQVFKEAPQILNSPKDREALLMMRIRAGDIGSAAKQFVENAAIDFRVDGMRNAVDASNKRFQKLKARAESGPSRNFLEQDPEYKHYSPRGRSNAPTNAASAYQNQMHELMTLDKVIESKPAWLMNFDYARERAHIQSLLENVKRELRNRGYNPDKL